VQLLRWKTPHKVVFNTKPLVAHYLLIRCRAYVYRRDIKAADKTKLQAHIRYLVGYDSSNIYRVWIPTRGRVIRTRDVIFKWQFSYKNDTLDKITADSITEQEVETLDLKQPYFTATAEDLYTTEQLDRHLEEMEISTAHADRPNTRPNTEKERSPMDSTRGTISPQRSPTQRSPTPRSPSPTNSTIAALQRPTPLMESRHAYEIPSYLPDCHNNNAPQAFNLDIGEHNVIARGRRSRRAPSNNRVLTNFFT
jgi:hypothetical protein